MQTTEVEVFVGVQSSFYTRTVSSYAKAIHAKNTSRRVLCHPDYLSACWGFIDSTIQQIARPLRYQQTCYNGSIALNIMR